VEAAAGQTDGSGVWTFEHAVLDRNRNAMVIHTRWATKSVGPARGAVNRAATKKIFVTATLGRAVTGNLVMALVPLAVDPPSAMQFANCVSAFRSRLPAGSSAAVVQLPKEAKPHFDVWGSTPTSLEIMKAVKRAMDPNNILNRGRFIV